ncbi:3-oxoacid CoA-transferase [Chloroflexota bacterium]
MRKDFATPIEAIWDVRDGASILFGGVGAPQASPASLIMALRDKGIKDITVISNSVGAGPVSISVLAEKKQIKKVIAAFGAVAGFATAVDEQIQSGEIELELVPQGVLCERLRAGAAGIPAIYSPTGVGTITDSGKEHRVFSGREYILETSLTADFAFIPAYRADTMGNLVYRRTSRNFNPVFAAAARVTIAEVEEIVEAGSLDPESIVTPAIYVDRIVKTTLDRDTILEQYKPVLARRLMVGGQIQRPGLKPGLSRELIAMRVAREFKPGDWVNLGLGLPALVTQFLPEGVMVHTEVGILAPGPSPETDAEIDRDTYGASGEFLTLRPGTSFCSNLEAFAMARSGRVSAVVLGAYQVSEKGDLANLWSPKMRAPGVGGAMDLVVGGAKVIVAMEHVTADGEARIIKECSYPLTALHCVSLIITDLAVIEVTDGGLLLREVAPGWNPEEVQALTAASLTISPDCREVTF